MDVTGLEWDRNGNFRYRALHNFVIPSVERNPFPTRGVRKIEGFLPFEKSAQGRNDKE